MNSNDDQHDYDTLPGQPDTPHLDCPICGGRHFERAGVENCAADHETEPPGGFDAGAGNRRHVRELLARRQPVLAAALRRAMHPGDTMEVTYARSPR